MTAAILPAAGKSTRMGRPKLSLPLGGQTVLQRVVLTLKAGGVDQVLVVVGPHVPELADLARAAGAAVCLLTAETPDMRATVEAGLAWLEKRAPMRDEDVWFLVPSDHPVVEPGVVSELLAARSRTPQASIVVPTWEARRGHPTLIDWKHVAGIRTTPSGEGINAYLRRHAAETLELPVGTQSVLLDLDTPEDYERLCRSVPEQESQGR
jgi:molybdenum cofactor cytidylyltransferase